MGKTISLDKIGAFFRNCFVKSSCKTETAAADNVVQFVERVSQRTKQKVTSSQVEAYYKNYDKCTNPIQKAGVAGKAPENAKIIDTTIETEINAYNRARFIEVSQEALNGLKHNFSRKRGRVKEIILSDSEMLPQSFISKVKNIKTPEELAFIIRSYSGVAENNLNKKYNDVIQRYVKTKVISLKDQQKLHRDEMQICTKSVELIKAVTEPANDPNVLAIEDYLRTRYGMEYVHIEDMGEAKRILKTVTLANKNGLPLPKNIIISPFTPIQASGANYHHSAQEYTVVLKSTKEEKTMVELAYSKLKSPQTKDMITQLRTEDSKWYSTDDELQRYVHEFVHGRQFIELLFPQKWEPVPKKYHSVIYNLGTYAGISRREVDAELKTKEILRSLNKEEKELLGYFEETDVLPFHQF